MDNEELIYQIGKRKVPRVGGHVLDFFEDKTVYDVSDLRIEGDVLLGRLKIEDRNQGWLPFVWFYKTGEVKLLTHVESDIITNSMHINSHDVHRVSGQIKLAQTKEKWFRFYWHYRTGSVVYHYLANPY